MLPSVELLRFSLHRFREYCDILANEVKEQRLVDSAKILIRIEDAKKSTWNIETILDEVVSRINLK